MNRYRQNHVVLRRVVCRQAESQTSFPASTSTVFNQFYVARDPSTPHLSSPLTLLTATSPPGSLRALDDNADQNADDKLMRQESTRALFLTPTMSWPVLSSPMTSLATFWALIPSSSPAFSSSLPPLFCSPHKGRLK